MSIPLFACAKRNGLHYNNKQDVFYLKNKPFFPYGWYISRSHDYIKLAAGMNNKFGFADPFSNYYNTFLVYTLYNDVYTLDSSIIDKKLSYLKAIPGKYFIVDLPRYSAQFRLFYREEHNEFKNIPSGFVNAEEIRISSTSKYNLMASRTPHDNVEAQYKFETESGNAIVKASYTDHYFTKGNATVYQRGHLINFAVKSIGDQPVLSIVIKLRHHNNTEYNEINYYIFNPEISSRYMGNKGIDVFDYVIPSESISGWQLISINIEKTVSRYAQYERYKIEGIDIYANHILLSTPSIAYNKDKRTADIGKIIDRIDTYKSENILGFYTVDEIERKAFFDYCKWQKPVNGNKRTVRYSQGLISICQESADYLKSKGYTSFMLSTPYVKSNSDYAMFDKDYTDMRDGFVMFDHYSYLEPYVNDFQSIRNYAENNNLGILFVADAYETDTKSVISFENTLFKIISSLTLGAKGLLFYTYNNPHTTDAVSFMNDKSKLHIGLIGKFLTDYHVFDMILNTPRYISRNNAHFVYGYDNDNNMIILCYRESPNINFLFDYIGQYVKETMHESLDNKLILNITPDKYSNMKMDYFPLVFSGGIIEQSSNIFTENRKVAVLIIPYESATSFSYHTEFVDGRESLIIETDYPQLIEKFTIISGNTKSAEHDFNNSYNSYITMKYLPLINLYTGEDIIIEYTNHMSEQQYDTIKQ